MMHKICWNGDKTIGIIVREDGDRLGLTYELRKGALNTLGVISSAFMDAWGDMTADDVCTVDEIDLPITPSPVPHLVGALTKINDIRNSIIGCQTINWSEHIYPLVAALEEAGFEGAGYPTSRANVGTMLERTLAAESEADRLRAIALDMQAAYVEATNRAEEAVKAANALQVEVDRFRAQTPPPQSNAVGIKALDWESEGKDFKAVSATGEYLLMNEGGQWIVFRNFQGISTHSNEAGAKVAAQVHHASLVRSEILGDDFPQPRRRDGDEPCGECIIQPGETCDICGAKAAAEPASMIDEAEGNIRADYRSGKISKKQFQKELLIVARARQQKILTPPPSPRALGSDEQ